jgi:hypothetical protein
MRDGRVHRGCIRTSADLGDRRAAASGGARGRPRQRGSPPMTTRAAASVGATPARGGQRRPPGSLERRRQHTLNGAAPTTSRSQRAHSPNHPGLGGSGRGPPGRFSRGPRARHRKSTPFDFQRRRDAGSGAIPAGARATWGPWARPRKPRRGGLALEAFRFSRQALTRRRDSYRGPGGAGRGLAGRFGEATPAGAAGRARTPALAAAPYHPQPERALAQATPPTHPTPLAGRSPPARRGSAVQGRRL